MLYNEIFEIDGESRIPDNWTLVGRWLCYRYERDYYDKVAFYALKPEDVEPLQTKPARVCSGAAADGEAGRAVYRRQLAGKR